MEIEELTKLLHSFQLSRMLNTTHTQGDHIKTLQIRI